MDIKTIRRYCSYCGNPIDPQTKECANCGWKYRQPKTIIVILLVILGLILIPVGSYFAITSLQSKQANLSASEPSAFSSEETELSAEEIYKLASPATVEIRAETENGTVTGTGFFDSADGTIITNFHVLADATSGVVYLNNGERYPILKLVGFDSHLDIAIIQINYQTTSILQTRTDLLQTGETVYALGSSLGLADSFSQGIISANQREINGQIFIQTTTPISHGNSGGPLIDKYGKVVGITTANIESGQNLNLAIPISSTTKIDRNTPIDFQHTSSDLVTFVLERTSLSYWEWVNAPKVVCDTRNNQYHYSTESTCFSIWRVIDKVPLNEDLPHPYVILDLDRAIKNGYEPCRICS